MKHSKTQEMESWWQFKLESSSGHLPQPGFGQALDYMACLLWPQSGKKLPCRKGPVWPHCSGEGNLFTALQDPSPSSTLNYADCISCLLNIGRLMAVCFVSCVCVPGAGVMKKIMYLHLFFFETSLCVNCIGLWLFLGARIIGMCLEEQLNECRASCCTFSL